MIRQDGRNVRPGLVQVGEVVKGNLVQFDDNGRIEDAGVSVAELQDQIDALHKKVEALLKRRLKAE